jgi:hypothetical protein
MPFIIKDSDLGTPIGIGVGTPTGVDDIIIPVDINPDCLECDPVAYLPDILCPGEDSWCCDIPNEANTGGDSCGNLKYCQPVVQGQCLYFQFQFQNTLNGKKPVSFQYWLINNQTIPYNWYHATLNPINWTIKAEIINAGTGASIDASPYIAQASVYLRRDDNASIGMPQQAWYRWHQQIQICLPDESTMGTNEFYLKFTVKNFAGNSTEYRSESYCYFDQCNPCDDLLTIEGLWNSIDCWGQNYLTIKDNTSAPHYNGSEVPPVLLFWSHLFNKTSQHRHIVVLKGHVRLTDADINKEIPDDECQAIEVRTTRNYQVYSNELLPPYVAEQLINALGAQQSLINGSILANADGLSRNSDVGDMFQLDQVLSGCPCVIKREC